MKTLNKIIIVAFLAFFFLSNDKVKAEESNIEKLAYVTSPDINPTNIAYYFHIGDPCRFYDYRVTHPRRCGYWYGYDDYYVAPYPWYRHHPYPHWRYWRPYRWHHHHRHHWHHR